MRNIVIFFFSCLLVSCSAQNPSKLAKKVLQVQKDSTLFNNNFVYLSEVSIKTSSNRTYPLINKIQELSENKWIQSKLPGERLSIKLEKLKNCLNENIQNCEYTPEGYEIRSSLNGIVNIVYTYNQLGSSDNYFKYGCYNLIMKKRVTYLDLFKEPLLFLKKFNEKYTSQRIAELAHFNEEEQEYDVISHHMETREPFQLVHLNNFELILKDKMFIAIRFHYNGLGGNYKSAVPNGFVEYSLKEIEPQLKKSFLKRLN